MLIPRGVLKLALCASREKTRYAMNGLHIERIASGAVKVTATDGKRLVRAELDPMTDTAHALASTFGIAAPSGPVTMLVPTMDELDRKGNVISLGLLSTLRNENKARIVSAKASGPRKPIRETFYPSPKRPRLPSLPHLPKRASFAALPGEGMTDTLARYRDALETARAERANVKASRTEIRVSWKMQRCAAKEGNAAIKARYVEALKAWKIEKKEARKARDVVAFDPSARNAETNAPMIGIAVTPGRVREMVPVEGHYPPVDDVLPSPSRAHRFELIADARAIELIVLAWRALLVADERATAGEQEDAKPDELSVITIELEGYNVTMHARHNGRALSLSEPQKEHIERWMRVVHGEGKMRIGINPFFLAEMAESLNAAIGVSGHSVRLGIKSDSDAVLVAPLTDDTIGPAFSPTVRGVKVTGVLMPINLS